MFETLLKTIAHVIVSGVLVVASFFGIHTPEKEYISQTIHDFSEFTSAPPLLTIVPVSDTKKETVDEDSDIPEDHQSEVPVRENIPPIKVVEQESVALPVPPETPQESPSSPEAFVSSTLPVSILNELTRAALVNILCIHSGTKASTGSGVIIDPRGIILTNAHVAQHFRTPESVCVIRAGYPALPRYHAELMHIPTAWLEEFGTAEVQLAQEHIGKNDFALLSITESATDEILPDTFPFILPYAHDLITPGFPFLLAGYPAGLHKDTFISTNLYASSVVVGASEFYTFDTGGGIDLIVFPGTAVTDTGSSGGAVVRATDAGLQGIIVALKQAKETRDRLLLAITLSHIEKSLKKETGKSLREFIDGVYEE